MFKYIRKGKFWYIVKGKERKGCTERKVRLHCTLADNGCSSTLGKEKGKVASRKVTLYAKQFACYACS